MIRHWEAGAGGRAASLRRRLSLWLLDQLAQDDGELCNAWGGTMPDGAVRLCGRPRWHTDSHAYDLVRDGQPTGPYRGPAVIRHWGEGPSALELARIVLDLAETDPVAWDPFSGGFMCHLCGFPIPDGDQIADHASACPWRRAREATASIEGLRTRTPGSNR